jgi:hypothetical protein
MRLLLAIGLAALAYAYVGQNHTLNFINSGPMDGTVWEVRIKPDSWFSFSHKDTLVFDSGRMAAVNYMATGFPSGPYSAAGHKGQCSWQVSFQRSNAETLEWTGRVQNDRMEGDIVQHESTGRIRQFHFRGTRRLS